MELDLKKMNESDPLKRMVEKQTEQEEYSPMDPPDAYSMPADKVALEQMHPFLQSFFPEHRKCEEELEAFETLLNEIREKGPVVLKNSEQKLSHFFSFFDTKIVVHNVKEEKTLFYLLNQRMIEKGDHSKGNFHKTAIDMLEDDHSKLMQSAAVVFNFFALSSRLPDAASRAIVLDAALEQGKELIEALRLHIFREENVVFPKAHLYLTTQELDDLEKKAEVFKHY
jgi:iron-sulfur cluster repair protein YtfE (RIC family)